LFAYGILKVLYAPHKAFKEISQNMKFIAPLVIMILFILAGTGSYYLRTTKLFVQKTTPSTADLSDPDSWTDNPKAWLSNANVTSNSNDRLFAVNSIQLNAGNDTGVWMKLNRTLSVDCSASGTYRNLTYSMKWIHPTGASPRNASLYLYSGETGSYFYRSFEEPVNGTGSGKWSNVTIPLGSDASQWLDVGGQASWTNINGLRIELSWGSPAVSNLTVLVDQMFFRSKDFDSLGTLLGGSVAMYAANFLFTFAIYWMLAGAVLFVGARMFAIKAELKAFLIIAGYSLIALLIMQVVFACFYAAIPPLYFSLESVTPVGIFEIVSYFIRYVPMLFLAWAIVISGFGVRGLFELPLWKGIVIAAIAFGLCYILFPIS